MKWQGLAGTAAKVARSLPSSRLGDDPIEPQGLAFHGGEGSVPSLCESNHGNDHPTDPVGELFKVSILDQIEFRTVDSSRPQFVEGFEPSFELEVILGLDDATTDEGQESGDSAGIGLGDLGIVDGEETFDAGPQLDEAHDRVAVAVGVAEPIQGADNGVLNLGPFDFIDQRHDPVEEADPAQIGNRLRVQRQVLRALAVVDETGLCPPPCSQHRMDQAEREDGEEASRTCERQIAPL